MALEILDVAMVAYNPDYLDEKPALDYAAKNNKGVLLKKALASGHTQSAKKSFEFAFAHPGVTSVIAGTISADHLQKNVRATISALSARAV